MVVQLQAHVRAARPREQAKVAQRRAGRRGRVFVAAVVVVETAWLLTLAWGVYALVF
jgi:hypothetical protein